VTEPGSTRQRLGDPDRDRVAEQLGRHYVEGRLDAESLGRRVEELYRAEFMDTAAALVADLPPLAGASPAKPRRRWVGRRHGEAEGAQPGWRPTPERFVDPTTERVMRVWIDPSNSSRHYVAEGRA
jgi:hypothetical protein